MPCLARWAPSQKTNLSSYPFLESAAAIALLLGGNSLLIGDIVLAVLLENANGFFRCWKHHLRILIAAANVGEAADSCVALTKHIGSVLRNSGTRSDGFETSAVYHHHRITPFHVRGDFQGDANARFRFGDWLLARFQTRHHR